MFGVHFDFDRNLAMLMSWSCLKLRCCETGRSYPVLEDHDPTGVSVLPGSEGKWDPRWKRWYPGRTEILAGLLSGSGHPRFTASVPVRRLGRVYPDADGMSG